MNQLIEAEYLGTQYALLRSGRMSQTIHLPVVNAHTVGQFMYFFEMVTAYVGELLDINAFNQPGVEESKIASYAVLGNTEEKYQKKQEEMLAAPKGKKQYRILNDCKAKVPRSVFSDFLIELYLRLGAI